MKTIDQLDSTHHLEGTPQRIVSLVPSITELLCDLGLEDYIVGCTKYCVHPVDLKEKVKVVGGTKDVDIDKVKALTPDIIFANKEENVKTTVDALESVAVVWVSDVVNYDDAIRLISSIGSIFYVSMRADEIIIGLKTIIPAEISEKKRVLYLIWRKPYMTIGGDTYISNMLSLCGYENVYKNAFRYPEVTVEEIAELDVDCIFLSSEPFPFKDAHGEELEKYVPGVAIHLVDGEFFSWYGSRQLHRSSYLQTLQDEIKDANV